ncbi:MAG: 3-hydroxyacyl-CoA dehydrogenase family protein [Chitinophagaceae bacterium]
MLIGVVADEWTKKELLAQGMQPGTEILWLDRPAVIPGAAAYIHLLFPNDPGLAAAWEALTDTPVIINDVLQKNRQLPSHFIRLNGWPTFLNRPLVEVASSDPAIKDKASAVFSAINKSVEWVPDVPGFVSARIVSMIINEAFYTLEDEVSTKEEIDTAMKLGTNYPYGPFEWAQQIGLKNICSLLDKLFSGQPRYKPSPLLIKEAGH